ncbi:MAG TPA: asparagine synthase-related protein [Candidatus Binataceae bacterium]|nr:asparagine synthase-related protein [Candidatus Binataceae bacterium]
MSGIAAIYNRDGRPADAAVLERMLAAAPYRGRDGFGRHTSGAVALGHAMLHATPESLHETQPLADETGAIVLTMDGRVDNRAALRAALEAAGRPPRDDTDAEIVLRAYQAWGEEFPRRILGDFALVIWDGTRRRLLCARDPFGVKTFYYFLGPRLFICASEPHQLFADPRVPREPNEGMIGELAVQYPATLEETLFRGILRLPPRYAMTVSADGVRRWRYYEPDPSAEIRYQSDDEYAEHFLSIFTEAVRCRLRSHGRILADLSGGLDSSSIVCTAIAMIARGDAKALFEAVAIPKTIDMDDSEYIEAVERKTGIIATKLAAEDADYATLAAQARHYQNLPDYPSQAMADYDSLLNARGDFRVQLTGVGGDEWLTGSSFEYADLLRGLRFGKVLGRLRREWIVFRTDAEAVNPLPILLACGVLPLMPRVRRLERGIRRRVALRIAPLTPEFARRIDLGARVRFEEAAPQFASFAQHDVYRAFTLGARVHPYEMMERWTSARGIEGRHPFVDRRIFEFALAIPEEQRVRGEFTRFVVRNAMRGILPEEVRGRTTKSTYGCSIVLTLEKAGGARLFDAMETVKLGWFDGEWLKRQYEETLRLYHARDFAYQSKLDELWSAVAIELWFNSVFSKPAATGRALPLAGAATR